VAMKQALIAGYTSQIDPEESERIASFAGTYDGGEQIWLPTPSYSAWGRLIGVGVTPD
jgi:hypothetical protein